MKALYKHPQHSILLVLLAILVNLWFAINISHIFMSCEKTKMPLKFHTEKICLVYQKDWFTGLPHHLDWFRFSLNMWRKLSDYWINQSSVWKHLMSISIKKKMPRWRLMRAQMASMVSLSVRDCSRVRGQNVLWDIVIKVHLLEKAMAPHSSTLAWKIPWTEEPGRLLSMGSLSQTWLSDFTFTFHFHALEKERATHSGVLAWKVPGTGEPGGLPSMGSHRVGHDWSGLAAAAAS